MDDMDTTFFYCNFCVNNLHTKFNYTFFDFWGGRSKIEIKMVSKKFVGRNLPPRGEKILKVTAVNKRRRPVILSKFGIEHKERGIPLETIYNKNNGPIKESVKKNAPKAKVVEVE